ncbi:hypothetical protein J2S52_000797 [Streptomyces sp. DSM 41037]|nr:hypothetical protein [Streptomyces sp. DSM 41037]
MPGARPGRTGVPGYGGAPAGPGVPAGPRHRPAGRPPAQPDGGAGGQRPLGTGRSAASGGSVPAGRGTASEPRLTREARVGGAAEGEKALGAVEPFQEAVAETAGGGSRARCGGRTLVEAGLPPARGPCRRPRGAAAARGCGGEPRRAGRRRSQAAGPGNRRRRGLRRRTGRASGPRCTRTGPAAPGRPGAPSWWRQVAPGGARWSRAVARAAPGRRGCRTVRGEAEAGPGATAAGDGAGVSWSRRTRAAGSRRALPARRGCRTWLRAAGRLPRAARKGRCKRWGFVVPRVAGERLAARGAAPRRRGRRRAGRPPLTRSGGARGVRRGGGDAAPGPQRSRAAPDPWRGARRSRRGRTPPRNRSAQSAGFRPRSGRGAVVAGVADVLVVQVGWRWGPRGPRRRCARTARRGRAGGR